MSETTGLEGVRVRIDGPDYLIWRSKILAEYNLALVPELTVFKARVVPPAGFDHAFLVQAPGGVEFAVDVVGYSSIRDRIPDPTTVPELFTEMPAEWVRRLRREGRPVVLFLFDADRDPGRVVRADTLPEPDPAADEVIVSVPAAAAVTPERLREFVAGLGQTRHAATG
jgi:hypothetical protein